jgi:glycosyltransferase involved in cell wall biosynthesis
MRVLHLTTTLRGGAGIAALRLNQALRDSGIESSVQCLTSDEQKTNEGIEIVKRSFIKRLKSKFLTYIQDKILSKRDTFLTAISIDQIDYKAIKRSNPDVINIHSMYNLVNHNSIKRLSYLGYPLVLTLHDQRAFTGGCHYSKSCHNYSTGCRSCPQANIIGKQIVKKMHQKQKKALSQVSHLTVVAPSTWLVRLSKNSEILGRYPSLVINNPIPLNGKANLNKAISKKIGFIATDLNNPLKNLSSLLQALKALDYPQQNLELLLIGKGEINTQFSNIKVTKMPKLSESQIVQTISSLDLLVVPSFEDNSPNVIGEALMNGTKVIGANTGGIPELLDDDLNLLFNPNDINGMSNTIMRNLSEYDKTVVKTKAESKFSFASVAGSYLKVYKSLI